MHSSTVAVSGVALFFGVLERLLSRDIITWQVVYPEEVILLEIVSSPSS
jgi:hypothetical protein